MTTTPTASVGTPSATDYYDVRSLLSEDEQAIQDAVARFVDERVLPGIAEAFDEHRFPEDLIPELAEMGLLGCNIEGYDCAGLNHVCYGLVNQELERGDAGVRSFVSVQGSLCMYPILAFGSEEQRQRWLPQMASAEVIGCFGLTEADGGSDPGAMKTTAKRDGGDWILNGSKMWITNGSIAHLAVVWAQTEDGIRGFLVEKDMPGYSTRDIERKYSLRASITSELFLDDVRVPDANMLPNVRGLKGPLSCLTQARYGIAWGVIGSAIACFQEVLDYSKVRVLFGRPLSHTQTVQRRLADMSRRITLAQLLALQLGRLKDEGKMHHSHVSMAKWNNVRTSLDIARDARDLLGASGISSEFCSIRHMLNLESVITYEGTETVHELVVGRELCGHSAY
ncbi:MAG: acyl-CoA dehydrogenase [Planctomycetes bacterium]|nr:acyl-CoA dehydrogenase [Planctomycetota bacterium]NOG53697.1 acyl-CoA dehydrogenase [Planctomycetota bacterium]